MKRKDSLIFLVGVLLFSLAACSEPTLISNWQSSEIKIDGNTNDWAGALKYFEDEKAAIGVSNNNDYIYFCLATSDNAKIMRILRNGFTVWLDPQSSDGETIGIQFPIKRFSKSIIDRTRPGMKEEENSADNLKKMINKFKIDQNEILIVNEDKFPLSAFPLVNNAGIEVNINYEMHQFVYELKFPLANNTLDNFYIDVLPNEIVRVGFESGEINKPEVGDRDNMSGSGNSDRMSSGGRGGKRGGGRSGNTDSMQKNTEPIEFYVEIKLAKEK